MIAFQNRDQLGQLFAALKGSYRQSLAVRLVIGVIMLAAGGGALFLGIMTFLEGNVQLSRFYELLISVIMILLASLAFYYAYYMNQIVYKVENNRFRALLLPDHLRWEVPIEKVNHARFISSPNGEQLEIHCTDGRVRRVLCTGEMKRIINAVHRNIVSQHPSAAVAHDPKRKLRLAVVGVLLLAAPIFLLVVQHTTRRERDYPINEHIHSATAAAAGRMFSDPAGYRVPVPEDWQLADHTGKNQLIRADITRDKNAGIQIRLQRCTTGDFNQLTASASRQYRQDMSRHWGGDCVELGSETVSPGPAVATRRFRLDRKDGQRWYLQLSCVCLRDNLIIMQGGCLWDERDMFADVFDGMVAGIQTASATPD